MPGSQNISALAGFDSWFARPSGCVAAGIDDT